MPISFACESCGKRYRVEDSAAGKRGKCKQCGHAFSIPASPIPLETFKAPSEPEPILSASAADRSTRKESKAKTQRRWVPVLGLAVVLVLGAGAGIYSLFPWPGRSHEGVDAPGDRPAVIAPIAPALPPRVDGVPASVMKSSQSDVTVPASQTLPSVGEGDAKGPIALALPKVSEPVASVPSNMPEPTASASPKGPGPTQADLDYLKSIDTSLAGETLATLGKRKFLSLGSEIDDSGVERLTSLPDLELLTIEGANQLTDVGFEHIAKLSNLKSLSITEPINVSAAGVAHLAKLQKLRDLVLNSIELSDAAIMPLAALTGLKRLSLIGTKLSDTGMSALKDMTELEFLTLAGTEVRGPGLAHLKPMTKLATLSFNVGPRDELEALTDVGLAELKDLPSLVDLDLAATSVTDAGTEFLQQIKPLKSLRLTNVRIGNAGLARLATLPNLAYLYLGGTRVTDTGLKALKGKQTLRNLSMRGTRITDAGLAHLKGLTELENLDLGYTGVGDVGMKHLKELKKLRVLSIEETRISNRSVPIISGFERLEFMNPRDSHISTAGETAIQKALPKLEIDHG